MAIAEYNKLTFKLAVLKYRRCHVNILNAVIDQQGRRQIFREIHMRESLGVRVRQN